MTFEEEYPNYSLSDADIPVDGDYVSRDFGSPSVYRCKCGQLTRWWSISFMAYYCSAECLNSEWESYWKACQSAPKEVE